MLATTKSTTAGMLAGVAPRQALRPQRMAVMPQAIMGNASAVVPCRGLRQQNKAAFTSSLVAPRRASRAQRAVSVRAEISYVMVKPDGVQRGLVGEIISRFERKGFKLVALKLYQTPREVAEEHYKDLKSKPFYPDLVDYIVSGPVVSMVWEGKGVVASARKLIGATNPLASEPGTIRGDFAIEVGRNCVHGSDSPENGEREAALWFGSDSLVSWSQTMEPWIKEEGRN